MSDVRSETAAIFERSKALALADVPDYIEDGDGGMWLPVEPRGKAVAFYASEHGIGFTDVRATRAYMRIDIDAIADLAADIAEDPAGYGDEPIAYTYEDSGWMWRPCAKGDVGALALWYCEVKPRFDVAALPSESDPS